MRRSVQDGSGHGAALVTALLIFFGLLTTPASAGSDTWKLDPAHTQIRFSWDHLGVSRQSGTFTEIYGSLEFSPTTPTAGSVEATAMVASLHTGVPALDKILKSSDYFDAKTYSRIMFRSSAVRALGPKTGEIDGQLTLRGITKPVTLNVTWNYTGEHPLAPFNPVHRGQWVSGFTARATIKRSDWGISRSAPLVSDEIQIEINAEFLQLNRD
ncbi:MAG: YceI family protein [Pseudomonadota bacterium]